MRQIAVVYYSRTGSTRATAQALAQVLAADVVELRPKRSYGGAFGFLRGVLDSLFRRTPELAREDDRTRYDLIVLASPVWASRISSPLRSYLKSLGRHVPLVAALSVSGRGGEYASFYSEIETLTGRPLGPCLELSQRETRSPELHDRLSAFAGRIRLAGGSVGDGAAAGRAVVGKR